MTSRFINFYRKQVRITSSSAKSAHGWNNCQFKWIRIDIRMYAWVSTCSLSKSSMVDGGAYTEKSKMIALLLHIYSVGFWCYFNYHYFLHNPCLIITIQFWWFEICNQNHFDWLWIVLINKVCIKTASKTVDSWNQTVSTEKWAHSAYLFAMLLHCDWIEMYNNLWHDSFHVMNRTTTFPFQLTDHTITIDLKTNRVE